MEKRRRANRFSRAFLVVLVFGLSLFLLAAFALSASFGEYALSWANVFGSPTSTDAVVFYSLRLPRAALAALVGAALAASGSTLQGLTRNPLADPFVLGVSGGAALGATFAIALGWGELPGEGGALALIFARTSAPSLFAFGGALLATGLVFALGGSRRRASPHAVLLSGVVFNALAAALITAVKTLVAPDKLGELLFWLAGTVGYERLSTLAWLFGLEGVAVGVMWALSGRLNLLSLGDDEARALGVPVEKTRRWLLVAASLSVAGAVAVSGMVGFVGLLVPHLLRLLFGPDQRLLLPASALFGAAFLLLADLAARLLFQVVHAEPPVGVVTALVGGPLFLWLLGRGEARKG